jgi:hypothetical protein
MIKTAHAVIGSEDDIEEAEPRMKQQKLSFEIDEISDPPTDVVQEPMVPSLWSNKDNGVYQDTFLNNDSGHVVYDYPKVMTDRNHLVRKGAMYFTKTKIGWRYIGIVREVVSTGVYEKNKGQKWAELLLDKETPRQISIGYKTKNHAIENLGFKAISDNERMHGLIPLYRK